METPIGPRIVSLHEIPDPRYPRGRRSPLAAMLAFVCVAMLCDYRRYSAIADWGRCYDPKLVRALGFTRDKTPCATTLCHVLRQLDSTLVAAILGAWATVEGRVIPVDALLTQRAIAQRIVAGGCDSVMVVKANQPGRHQDLPRLFQDGNVLAEPMMTTETVDGGHGRTEQRHLTPSTALLGYRDWPGLAQVFRWERRVTMKASGAQRSEVVYGATRAGGVGSNGHLEL
jgi:hypothetical protein